MQNHLLRAAAETKLQPILLPHLRPFSASKGEILQESGRMAERVCFPEAGMGSVLIPLEDGRAIETLVIGKENAFDLAEALGGAPATSRVLVQGDMTGHAMSAATFVRAFQDSEPLRILALRAIQGTIGHMHQSVACNALHEIEKRLARWLLECRDRIGSDSLELTQEFLAQILGVRRTSVTEIAGILQRKGLITYHRGSIQVVDVHGLERHACECYALNKERDEYLFDWSVTGRTRAPAAASLIE